MIDGVSENAFRRFGKRERVALAVLFGSAASKRTTAPSDLDVAFWLDGKQVEGRELELTNGLMQLLHRNDVDVVVLNHASPLLQWQVASTGTPLYERRKGTFHQFQVSAMKRYDDTRRLFALQDRFLDRVVKGVRPAWQTSARSFGTSSHAWGTTR
jgi:predicted nucleotidyltransferase